MRLVSVMSMRGGPGVTTLSTLLASCWADSVVAEADATGGVLAARYGLGREPGLATFAASRSGPDERWRDHAQDAGGVAVLVGPDSPVAAAALWRSAGERIVNRLVVEPGTAVMDSGRFQSAIPAVINASDAVVVVLHPVAEHLVAFSHALPVLRREIRGALGVVLAGSGPYRAGDLRADLDVAVFGSLPFDLDAAEAVRLGGLRSRVHRTRLARAAVAVSECIDEWCGPGLEVAS